MTRTTRDLPEGTLYIPPLLKEGDAPNADREIKMYLRQIGLVRSDDDEE